MGLHLYRLRRFSGPGTETRSNLDQLQAGVTPLGGKVRGSFGPLVMITGPPRVHEKVMTVNLPGVRVRPLIGRVDVPKGGKPPLDSMDIPTGGKPPPD